MQWAVWVRSHRWNGDAPVNNIKQTFESMGFAIRPQRFNYYNPTRANRFVVEHSNPGAIMLWTMGWSNHWPHTTVEITEYAP